jgi:ArsR family transcriptional regulator
MEDTAKIFKALSDETRLRIMALLDQGERCVCDLMAVLGLPQSTVSRHLAYLKNGGWVSGHRNGMWMYYYVHGKLSPLQAGVLDLLRTEFKENDRARQDMEALRAFLKTKNRQCT